MATKPGYCSSATLSKHIQIFHRGINFPSQELKPNVEKQHSFFRPHITGTNFQRDVNQPQLSAV